MPCAARTRTSLPGHSKAAPASKTIATPDALDDSYMMDPAEMAPMQAPRIIEQPTTSSLSTSTPQVPLDEVAKHHREDTAPRRTKAEKAQAKRQNLLDQINSRSNPYSKSHSRRLKRASRPSANLVTSLSDVHDVLPEIEPAFDEPTSDAEESDGEGMVEDGPDIEKQHKNDSGKGREKLTAKKRQRVLTSESTRLPAIMSNSSFSKSPFATIKMHTLNTMAAQKAQTEATGSSTTGAKRKKGGRK